MALILLYLLSCATEPNPVEAMSAYDVSAVALLERASLDLRGVRPSIAEVEAVEADPASVNLRIEEFLQDPRFGERVRSFFADIYLTRQDAFPVTASDYGSDDEATFAASVGDEPLQILSAIAEQDLPYSQIVTADWTMSNELLATTWPIAYPEGAEGWQRSTYTDGRPHSGILTTNGMWWRYQSNGSNSNRGRANALSRILLCTDYLSKPIDFDRNVNLLDDAAVNDALKTNEGCVACHYSLDPLGSYLWGFYFVDYNSKSDTSSYHPEREETWQTTTEVAPGYYGQPGYTLDDLGGQIAADPKLAECITQQVFEKMTQRTVTLDDTERLTTLRETFLANGQTLRSLFLATAGTPEYQEALSLSAPSRKLVSPDQLASMIEDITGFRFTYQGFDMMQTDAYGVRTLAGGVDGVFSTRPASEATATMVLVHERLAQAAAWYVVNEDRTNPSEARLFTEVGVTTTPTSDPEAMAAQVQLLHLRLFGKRIAADGEEVAANLALWSDLYDVDGDPAAAWAGVLSVLLRDPEFLLY